MINNQLHKATHDNEYVQWENEEIDYNMIEKSIADFVDNKNDIENYFNWDFKREGTKWVHYK